MSATRGQQSWNHSTHANFFEAWIACRQFHSGSITHLTPHARHIVNTFSHVDTVAMFKCEFFAAGARTMFRKVPATQY